MTGPPYPFPPAPGSNAIGSFTIGVSPIGTIREFDVWETVISQYANSPIITTLINDLADAIDPTVNIENFFDQIMNVDTAEGYGLDVWGRIVGVNRVLKVASGPRYWGFYQGLPDYDPFMQSPWYMGQPLTTNYALTDDGFRVLILAKAFANICDGSINAINVLLKTLFGSSGKCYCTDGLDMTMTYTFEFPLSPLQASIVENSGVLPRPVGVEASVVQVY